MSLALESEPFGRLGNVSARGFSNQLGRPDLDALSVLVREAVQNSWDARLKKGNVQFDVTGWQLSPTQRSTFAEMFADRPQEDSGLGALITSKNPITLMALSDRGTVGLNGPTSADEVEDEESSNFVDFLRNAGRKPETAGTGGTYGYGKAAFFAASSASTIIAYTRFETNRGLPTRLMAASWGNEFATPRGRKRERFTGRHWWGAPSQSDRSAVEPLMGQSADSAAKHLGIPGFSDGQTGTSVVVIAPTFGDLSEENILRSLGRTLLLYFWPRMLKATGRQSLEFSYSWNGVAGSIPTPESSMPMDQYALALRAIDEFRETGSTEKAEVLEISSQRPAKVIGHLALRRFLSQPRGAWIANPSDEDALPAPLEIPTHHVALMRRPRQVVRYFPGPELATAALEYAGVFLAVDDDDDVELALSEAEPPTHDDWVARGLKVSSQKTIVNVAMRELKAKLREFVGGKSGGDTSEGRTPLGYLSYALKGLVPGLPGTGSEEQVGRLTPVGGGGSGGGRRETRPIAEIVDVHHENGEGGLVAVLSVELGGSRRLDSKLRLTALPTVRVDDGASSEAEPPAGAAVPRVLYWLSSKGRRIKNESSIIVLPFETAWKLAISMPPDAMIGVAVDAEYAS